jgi:hypothetical protein
MVALNHRRGIAMVRWPLIVAALLVLAAVLLWLFLETRPIPGVEPKGDAAVWMPWVTLAGSIVSLLTAMVTLALKLIEMRGTKPGRKKA